MNRIDELKAQGHNKIPFQYFVEMYSGDARFERIADNQYRILSFNPESVRSLPSQKNSYNL